MGSSFVSCLGSSLGSSFVSCLGSSLGSSFKDSSADREAQRRTRQRYQSGTLWGVSPPNTFCQRKALCPGWLQYGTSSPSFHRDFDEEDLIGVFKRSVSVVAIYVRLPGTGRSHAWPDWDCGMVSLSARPVALTAYKQGSLSRLPPDHARDLQWSLNLIQAALEGRTSLQKTSNGTAQAWRAGRSCRTDCCRAGSWRTMRRCTLPSSSRLCRPLLSQRARG